MNYKLFKINLPLIYCNRRFEHKKFSVGIKSKSIRIQMVHIRINDKLQQFKLYFFLADL